MFPSSHNHPLLFCSSSLGSRRGSCRSSWPLPVVLTSASWTVRLLAAWAATTKSMMVMMMSVTAMDTCMSCIMMLVRKTQRGWRVEKEWWHQLFTGFTFLKPELTLTAHFSFPGLVWSFLKILTQSQTPAAISRLTVSLSWQFFF